MIENNIRINYNFYYWGPYLYKTTFPKQYCEELLEKGKKTKQQANKDLAGHIEKENYFDENDRLWFKEKSKHYFDSYIDTSRHFYGERISKSFEHKKLWINFMKKGEFNPMHVHNDDLSFVIFLQVPEELKKENEKYEGTDKSVGPGGLIFLWGESNERFTTQQKFFPKEGDFFIFPSRLRHMVYPFKSDVERISVSGNIKLLEPTDK
jgi:uncharacterized protein (TIGR02466 family)